VLALVRSRGGAAEATRRVVTRERLGEDSEVAQALAGQRLLIVGRDEGKGEETALTSRETSLQIPIALAIEALRIAPVLEADTATRHAIRTAAPRSAA
jgi:hypothetical protein